MKALIIVDMQHDFMPGGALGVKEADQLVPLINELIDLFERVIVSMDWHPKGHVSFASTHGKKPGDLIKIGGVEQTLWPDHCVQGTHGAALVKGIKEFRIERIFQKGTDPKVESYSVFFDERRRRSTGLADYLRKEGIRELYFTGVATDYCVLYSALDALEMGFDVSVIRDACKAIGDEEKALSQMQAKGAKIVFSSEIL